MIGETQKIPQRNRIGAAPADATLGGDAREISHQHHAEENARRERGPPRHIGGGVVRFAKRLHLRVEIGVSQKFVQRLVKAVAFAACGGEEHLLLLRGFAFAHDHVRIRSQVHAGVDPPSAFSRQAARAKFDKKENA